MKYTRGVPDLPSIARRRPDAEDVRRAQRGDAEAWGRIVEAYSPYVYAIIRSTRLGEAEQPDAFQHVFVELYSALPDLRNTQTLAPWIRQTTLRHSIRLRERTNRTEPLDEATFISDLDLQKDLETADLRHMIRAAIRNLSPKCIELIQRLFFEEPAKPYAAVAADLGLSASSMSVTRHRCLKSLEILLRGRGIE